MITITISDNDLKAKEALFSMLKAQELLKLDDQALIEKKGILYRSVVESIEKPLIEQALERTEGNQLKAARILGINRNTMRSKIKKFGINPEKWKIS